jgi:hypothetical protein
MQEREVARSNPVGDEAAYSLKGEHLIGKRY